MRTNKFILMIMLLGIFINGCESRKSPSDEGKIVAKINNYEMTVGDFKDEIGQASSIKYMGIKPEAAKEELLEQLITKNILVQEAQRENFDKDRAFMDEIQGYWEQALLKLLLKKKIKELSRQIHVNDQEARIEYDRLAKEGNEVLESYEKMSPRIKSDILNRKIQAALDAWIASLRKNANVKIYKNNLNQ